MPRICTAVPSRKVTKKQLLHEYLEARQGPRIGEVEWRELTALLAPVSEDYLRELLHAAGVLVDQPFDGVRHSTFEALQSSLNEMELVYAEAQAAGDRQRALLCRRTVIRAKDRARIISRNPNVTEEKRREKEEMVNWMLVWLENPGIFSAWAALRTPRI